MCSPIHVAAREYTERGWSVIPTLPNKRPAVDWKRWTQEIASPRQVDDWFSRWSGCIGVICGQVSGLIVADIEANGLPSYRHLPMTRLALSQSGGLHWYYKYTEQPVTHSLVEAGVHLGDVRSNGQYVLAPPSRGEAGRYIWLNRLDLSPLPDEFLKPEPALSSTMCSLTRSVTTLGNAYASRSERLFVMARKIVDVGGSFEDYKELARADWSYSKVEEKGDHGDWYLEYTFNKALSVPRSTYWRVATLVSVSHSKTARGKRVKLQLRTDDGIEVYQGVTLIEGSERTESLHRALPVLKPGKRCRVDITQITWMDRPTWRVRHFEPEEK